MGIVYVDNLNYSIPSDTKPITCGVPQGSILGPLLFILYINDMHSCLKEATTYNFADDTSLLFSHKNTKVINKIMNSELKLLFDWLCANRLSLNAKKTEFMIFRPPRKRMDSKFILRLNNTKLRESFKIKYLGVFLDNRLTWKFHIKELCKKLSRAVGIIFKMRHYCTESTIKYLYYSMFNSHLSYGISLWGKMPLTI